MKYRFLLYLFVIFNIAACKTENTDNFGPNIILISADDLGWSDLGCYGSEINTPNLDKLAEEGMRFTQFHNTSKCFPSRASLITGVYAHDCGYDTTFNNPIKNAVTIGEVLREKGYLTYWSGKHHGKENPITRGFDRYYGLKDGACNFFNPGAQREGEAKPAQKNPTRTWCIDSMMHYGYTPKEKDFYTTDYFTHYAIDYMKDAAEKKKPFFLYLAYTAPHDPLMAWPEDIAKYKGKYDLGYGRIRNARYNKQLKMGLIDKGYALSKPTFKPWDTLTLDQKEFEAKKMEVYAAMIDRMDQNIGRVLDELESLGQLDNSIILFVSDNGASSQVVNLKNDNDDGKIGGIDRWISLGLDWANVSNTPYRFYKNYSYEGGINTPLIAWWPNKIKSNSFSSFSGHFIDIMPTIIEITGATYPDYFNKQDITPMRGISLLPILEGKEAKRDKPIFWQWKEGRALLQNNWKIVKHGIDKPWDLYNIEEDPTETNNLNNMYPDKIIELDSMFINWISKYNN
ncbi:arylsulfatase [Flavivirga spongiicola]|uniref:Arylsulfatase n=1 Tax=Flavivirga spongiicola TaxID=421621 RepID=A0ABU7XQ45_9FLAO|nr:arylsulfatase [Flavivirga sp. MEBiC05379]MDO5977904.1 arylsulfatase [Flavivirga sp. MEBiC05379]